MSGGSREPPVVLDDDDDLLHLRDDDARQYNIDAAHGVVEAVRSTFGPRGLDKMLVGTTGDTTVTNDGVTVLNSMDIDHPAAKLLVQVARAQEEEVGDGTTTAVLFAGALLRQAEDLLERGLHPVLIVDGYHVAVERAFEDIDDLADPLDAGDDTALERIARTSLIGTSVETDATALVPLLVEAVRRATVDGTVDFDLLQVHAHAGRSITRSEVFTGAVVEGDACHEAMPREIDDARVMLLDGTMELEPTEHEVRVEADTADGLAAILADEETRLDRAVEHVLETGANVVLVTGNVDDRASAFLSSEGVLAVDHLGWGDAELRFLRDALGAAVVTDLGAVAEDTLGHASVRRDDEHDCFLLESDGGLGASLVLRGATRSVVDEIDRSASDALDVMARAIADDRTLPGGGAVEVELAARLRGHADGVRGPQQLAVGAFADALETIPRTLASNAGFDVVNVLTGLRAAHAAGDANAGLDVSDGSVLDAREAGIVEPAQVKEQALLGATRTAAQLLEIDLVVSAEGLSPVVDGDESS